MILLSEEQPQIGSTLSPRLAEEVILRGVERIQNPGRAVAGLTAWILVLLGAWPASAQEPKPAFEVASVKPQREPVRAENIRGMIPRAQPGGRFDVTHATVESLVLFAYDLKPYQVAGWPDWVRTDRFAINARAERDVPADQIRLMVQSLLEDRFKLVAHKEPREIRLQALVLARADGALGPSIFRMDEECSPAVVNELRRKRPEKYLTPIANGMMSGCSSAGLNNLADYLTLRLEAPVIDATGLKGSYYYSLLSQPPLSTRLGAPKGDSSGLPDLSTALQEQLGLKLESRRGPMDVLVIDSVQPPTEN